MGASDRILGAPMSQGLPFFDEKLRYMYKGWTIVVMKSIKHRNFGWAARTGNFLGRLMDASEHEELGVDLLVGDFYPTVNAAMITAEGKIDALNAEKG